MERALSVRISKRRAQVDTTPDPEGVVEATPAPRGRGRPRGSKNKKKKLTEPRSKTQRKPKYIFKKLLDNLLFLLVIFQGKGNQGNPGKMTILKNNIMAMNLLLILKMRRKIILCQVDQSEVICYPWIEMDPNDIPQLTLPDSSADIPLPTDHIMDVVEVCLLFNFFSFFHDTIYQVHYSVNDTNNAFNVITFCLESMTYAEVLRQYLESDTNVPVEVMEAVSQPNYPFVDIAERIIVLTFLSYRFLYSNEYRKAVQSGGTLINEDTCRGCNKGGELLWCTNCEASFHQICVELEEKPSSWICDLCQLNQFLKIISNVLMNIICANFSQQENENELHYYSTAPQFYELVNRMDPHQLEYQLCKNFYEQLSNIMEQMSITLELTSDRREASYQEAYSKNKLLPNEVYLHRDNLHRMSGILISAYNTMKEDNGSQEEFKNEEGESYKPLDRMEAMLGLEKGRLVNNFWSGNMDGLDTTLRCEYEAIVVNYKRDLESNLTSLPDPHKQFRMGDVNDDGEFRSYRNHFAVHEFGEHPTARKKQADKKKYLSTRFSLSDEGEGAFEWSVAKGRDMYGNDKLQAKYIEWTLAKLVRKIPIELMHRRWPEVADSFKKRELAAADSEEDGLVWVKHTKLVGGISHTLYRMKDESYRINGRGELGGWLWVSKTLVRDFRELPSKTPLGITARSDQSTLTSLSAKKAYRLDVIARKLNGWRTEEEMAKGNQHICICYSPTCRLGIPSRHVNWSLFLFYCKDSPTQQRVSLKLIIFMLKTKPSMVTLRRLAKTGGCVQVYINGFSQTAKSNYQIWNYPCLRPCFDLCWRWLTTNSISLHAVALQLRILWCSIRWADMEPEDDDPDRRVVVHHPDHDERRWIKSHKEFPPPGIYERFLIGLFKKGMYSGHYFYTGTRKKRQVIRTRTRKVPHLKEEWIDGVELKLYEIKDYWSAYNAELIANSDSIAPRMINIQSKGTPILAKPIVFFLLNCLVLTEIMFTHLNSRIKFFLDIVLYDSSFWVCFIIGKLVIDYFNSRFQLWTKSKCATSHIPRWSYSSYGTEDGPGGGLMIVFISYCYGLKLSSIGFDCLQSEPQHVTYIKSEQSQGLEPIPVAHSSDEPTDFDEDYLMDDEYCDDPDSYSP
uniref:PHD domain-containing protein n=1 Tax=Heterorhabditis bacteriophora TaxID=37862 RepID=A0A1I7XIQ6_HETBA